MLGTGSGFLAGLIAKLAGLGSVAKVAIATSTAALTMTVAGAAAGVLPFGGGHSAPAVTEGGSDGDIPVAGLATPTTSGDTGAQAGGGASVATPPGSASATAGAAGGVEPSAVAPSIPSLPIPGPEVPDLSGLTQVPTQVLNCLAPVIDLATGLPTAAPAQIAQIGPTVVSCVSGIVQGLPLPFGLDACLSEIMGFVSEMTSQLPTGIPNVGNLNVAACIPTGLPVPTSLPGGLPFMGGGFMGGGFPFGG